MHSSTEMCEDIADHNAVESFLLINLPAFSQHGAALPEAYMIAENAGEITSGDCG